VTGTEVSYTMLTCIAFMALVGWIAYQKTKGEVDTQDGYFLAGRGLTGTFIAGSLLLTNLSAEQRSTLAARSPPCRSFSRAGSTSVCGA